MPTEFGRTKLDAGVTDPGYRLFVRQRENLDRDTYRH